MTQQHLIFDDGDSTSDDKDNEIRILELFSGTGGFTLASELSKSKYTTVLANDIDEKAGEIYSLNFPYIPMLTNDIHNINCSELPPHDILTAGFPCQPFSVAGQQKGFSDSRSNVWWKIIEIMEHFRPRFAIFENVKNLLSHAKGNTFKIIEQSLIDIKYNIKYKIYNTSKITGIPHNRERVYIIACRDEGDYERLDMDIKEIEREPISNFLEQKVGDKYYYKESSIIYPKLQEAMIKFNTFYQYRRTIVRENKTGVCPTLTANGGTGGHNVPLIRDKNGIRKLTPRECFNFQGFSKQYKLTNKKKIADSHLYKLAGNAITVPIATILFNKIGEIY